MKIMTSFRNLDSHGQYRAPEVIAQEAPLIGKRLTRFREDLVHLEATASQTRGKTRIEASLRLQLPSGVIAAHEEGFEIEPVLRAAFARLRKRLDRHLSRLRHEPEVKRPARRRALGTPLPPARDAAEAERRALYFDLIEDHLEAVYNRVRRELTYLEAGGEVPTGRLSVGSLVDATILKGLETFEKKGEFSIGDWLRKLAHETIEAEARAARLSVPDDSVSIDDEPETPAQDPTEADQEMFEFYQPDAVLLLEELVPDEGEDSAEEGMTRRARALALHRAMADLPALWRTALNFLDLDEMAPAQAAAALGISEAEVTEIAGHAHAFLRCKLQEAGIFPDKTDRDTAAGMVARELRKTGRLPLPVQDRDRVSQALTGSAAQKEKEVSS